ncbi:serine hydrolase domain-containing protein [Planctomyces sp. SH-PL62]|uniref:serine hydrolase domain-containing protein n=1 Tax=Planctomyces sp. SH-PL62 TaxID=1636152 RepID=UPI0009ECEBEA|nr:serine hydrolase domain-containing protein [Planctomyces sp. SH-PL62]
MPNLLNPRRLPPLSALAIGAAWLSVALASASRGEDAPKVAPQLRPFVDSGALAGAVTLVASPERVLSLEAVGWSDVAARTPMATDAVFWIASQSKPMTAAALMILVDEGKVDVDAPVATYLPEFGDAWVAVERDDRHVLLKRPGRPVLVRDVLSHTSGLPFRSPIETPTLDVLPLASRVRSYATLPLLFEPGSKSLYSNAGINVAGRIIEVVSGSPYETFLRERLFQPLGMVDATFRPEGSRLARVPKAYKPGGKGLEATPIDQLKYPLDAPDREPMPAGGLFATADDVSRFYRMLANDGVFEGRRILSEPAVRMMTSDQSGDARSSYGFGLAVDGAGFGHGGAYGTHSSYDRERRLITVFLVQHAAWGPGGDRILPTFQQAARDLFGSRPQP